MLATGASEYGELGDAEEEKEKCLYFAVTRNDADGLKSLIRDGADINYTFEGSNQLGKSILHLSCETGSLISSRRQVSGLYCGKILYIHPCTAVYCTATLCGDT